jgi:hypothetical protein
MKRTTGHFVDKAIRWGLKNWYQVGWAAFGCYMLYAAYQMEHRFLAFTEYLYEKIEAHDASAPDPPLPHTPNTTG